LKYPNFKYPNWGSPEIEKVHLCIQMKVLDLRLFLSVWSSFKSGGLSSFVWKDDSTNLKDYMRHKVYETADLKRMSRSAACDI